MSLNLEQSLLARARQFDLEALAGIYDEYSPALYRYAMRLLGDPAWAEECVAATFSRFLAALKEGGGPQQHLRAYLYRMAHHWICDYYRRGREDETLHENLEQPQPFGSLEQQAAFDLQAQQVRQALWQLTPDQRQVVLLRFLEGMENEEVAQALQKPVGAVKALQHRALDSLRRLLKVEEGRDEK